MRILMSGANGRLGSQLWRNIPSHTDSPKDRPDCDLMQQTPGGA